MKKIFILLRDITESGGGERVCANLANAFSEYFNKDSIESRQDFKNCQIEIISFFKAFESPTFSISNNVKITYLSHKNPNDKNKFKRLFNKTIYRIYLSLKALKYIKDSNMESNIAILANDGTFMPLFKIKNAKLLRLWHIKPPKKKKKIFARFDTIIILSKRDLSTWQRFHKNVKVIPNFLPTLPSLRDFKTTLDSTLARKKRVLAAGRFTKEKGFWRLIDIYSNLANDFSDWELVIVGQGRLENELKAQIEIMKMQDSIRLVPFSKNMESLYENAEIFASSSYHEGFGMVILEAASFGLPSVAFDSIASELILDSKSGYVLPNGDNNGFEIRLKTLMQERNLREKMGKEARKLVESNFTPNAIIPLWHTILF